MLKSSLVYVVTATLAVFLITAVDGEEGNLKSTSEENGSFDYEGKMENGDMSCGSPPEIEGAIVPKIKGPHMVGTTVKYQCNFGYVSRNSGNFVSACEINLQTGKAEWTNPVGSCVARSCGDPGYVVNGRHFGNLFTFPNKVEFRCDEGYKLRGLNARFCQASGEWSGRLPTCELVFCSKPPDLVNGRVLYSSLEYGSELRYECNRGFILRNHQTRFCTSEGTWSNNEPECIEARCERPTSPAHGSVQMLGEPTVGSLAMYTCDEDTTMVGASTSKCLDTGIWTFDSPQCLRSCKVIEVKNGVVGTMEKIRRYPRFVRLQEGEIVKHGDSVSLRCNAGFTSANPSIVSSGGSDEVLCDNGEWSKPLQCEEMLCLGNPPAVENGSPVIKNRTHGSVIWYTCIKPFAKLETGLIQCDKGAWRGNTPVCGDAHCYTKQLNYPGLSKLRAARYNNGSSAGIKCDSGYVKTISQNKVVCHNGKWNLTENPCSIGICKENPPFVMNAFPLQFKREHGSVVDYQCAEKFRMVKNSTVRCEIDKWIGDPPQCQERKNINSMKTSPGDELRTTEIKETFDVTTERSSSSLTPLDECFCSYDFQTDLIEVTLGNTWLNEETRVSKGETVSFRCRHPKMQLKWPNGSKFFGMVNLTCNDCERWAKNELPTCESEDPGESYLVFRNETRILPGGVIEISKGSNTEFRCINFYIQPEWHGEKTSGISSYRDSGERIQRNRFYSSYLYLHSVDYEHAGKYECFGTHGDTNYRATTLEFKVSEVVPEIQCLELQTDRGQFSIKYENDRKVSTAAYYSCAQRTKKLIGHNSRTCKKNGKWSGSYPSCEDITCPELTLYNGLVASYTNSNKMGSVANFRCRRNTELVGSNSTECLSDGSWSNPQPTCQNIVTCSRFESSDGLEVLYSNDVKVDSTATFSCSPPKQLSGSSFSRCQHDGIWSQPQPSCETPGCSIDILMNSIPEDVVPDMSEVIANADGYLEYDSELQFLCEGDLILTGSSTTRCGLGGNWVHGTVECIRGCRLGTDVPPQLLVEPIQEHYAFGEMITFSCLPGQKLSSEVERVMCLGKSWSDPIPSCVEIEQTSSPNPRKSTKAV